MKKEIFEANGLRFVRFDGHVPVEIREALMDAGCRFDWTYNGWYVPTDLSDEEIGKIINDTVVSERVGMSKVEEAAIEMEYLRKEQDALGLRGDSWVKYFKGKIGALVRLEDGSILNIEKPSIETSFCYGESGYDADDAYRAANRARTSEDHFRRENLMDLEEAIRVLERRPSDGYVYRNCVAVVSVKGIAEVSFCGPWDSWNNKPVLEVSEEDRERILEGYRKVYAAFEKRINTYLKRYGLSKVRAWTYWRDA